MFYKKNKKYNRSIQTLFSFGVTVFWGHTFNSKSFQLTEVFLELLSWDSKQLRHNMFSRKLVRDTFHNQIFSENGLNWTETDVHNHGRWFDILSVKLHVHLWCFYSARMCVTVEILSDILETSELLENSCPAHTLLRMFVLPLTLVPCLGITELLSKFDVDTLLNLFCHIYWRNFYEMSTLYTFHPSIAINSGSQYVISTNTTGHSLPSSFTLYFSCVTIATILIRFDQTLYI